MSVNSYPEFHDFIELFRRLAAVVFYSFYRYLSDSVQSDVESWLSAHFLLTSVNPCPKQQQQESVSECDLFLVFLLFTDFNGQSDDGFS